MCRLYFIDSKDWSECMSHLSDSDPKHREYNSLVVSQILPLNPLLKKMNKLHQRNLN